MKKISTLAAALFAAAVFSSAPLMAQDVASVEAVVAQYQTLVTQYQGENMTAEQAQTQALADIKSQVQAMLEAAPDQETKEILLQAALEAAAVLCVTKPETPDVCELIGNDAVSAVLAAATAAGMSADSITAVAAASEGIDQDLVAQATASGGPAAGTGLVAGPGVAAPGGAGFGGGSGGGGGTASAN